MQHIGRDRRSCGWRAWTTSPGSPPSEAGPGLEMEPMGESEPLTAEELAMLLADDEDEAQER